MRPQEGKARQCGRYVADGSGQPLVRLLRFKLHRGQHARDRSARSLVPTIAAPSVQRLSCLRPPAAARLAGASVSRALAVCRRGGHEGRARRARFGDHPRRTVGEVRPPVAQALRLAHLVKEFGLRKVMLPSGRFADVDEPRQATLAQGKPFAHDFVEGGRWSHRHDATPRYATYKQRKLTRDIQLTPDAEAYTARAAPLWRYCGGEKLSAAVAEMPQFGCAQVLT